MLFPIPWEQVQKVLTIMKAKEPYVWNGWATVSNKYIDIEYTYIADFKYHAVELRL